MSNKRRTEIASLELTLKEHELTEEKRQRAEEKLFRLRLQGQSMQDTVVMTAEEKNGGHTPRHFHRPATAKQSH